MSEMDHELTHSASDQSIGSRSSLNIVSQRYEICVHTCTESGCVSKKTKTILWNKEGHAVRKHAHNPRLHPRCTKGCPGQRLIKRTDKSMAPEGGRDATNHEGVAAHIGTLREDVYPSNDGEPMLYIIYIPDAAMKITSKEKAQNDLGFIPTTLSESEYEPLHELEGSIHVISKTKAKHSNTIILKVIMQEWVSVFL